MSTGGNEPAGNAIMQKQGFAERSVDAMASADVGR